MNRYNLNRYIYRNISKSILCILTSRVLMRDCCVYSDD